MQICGNWNRYSGIKEPKCDNGVGCVFCWTVYGLRHDRNHPEVSRFLRQRALAMLANGAGIEKV